MADDKQTTSTSQENVQPPDLTAERLPPSASSSAPPFESDSFLDDKKPDLIDKKPEPSVVAPQNFDTPRTSKRGGIGFLTALLMSTVAAGAGAFGALFAGSRPDLMQNYGMAGLIPQSRQTPSTRPDAASDATNLAPLVARVSAVEAELLALKTRLDGPASATTPSPATPNSATLPKTDATGTPSAPLPATAAPTLVDNGALTRELTGISGRVTAMETRLAALDPSGAGGAIIAGLQSDIAGLKANIGALQQQAAAAPSPAVTFAVVNLAEAANRPGPFMVEFETLQSAMPGVPEVAAIQAFARTGVPTRAMLQERFSSLAPAVRASEGAAKTNGGIMGWFRSFFADMVKVQSAPDVNGTSNMAILLRAQTKLEQSDLSGSIAEVAKIANPPTLVTEWVASARNRLELESRVNAIRGAMGRVPAVSNTIAPPPPPALLQTPSPATKTQGTN